MIRLTWYDIVCFESSSHNILQKKIHTLNMVELLDLLFGCCFFYLAGGVAHTIFLQQKSRSIN